MLISIHVPKTAGTNFTRTLETIYEGRVHLDYGTENDLVAVRTPAPEIAADPAGVARRIAVIHGHFHFPKYARVFPDAPVLATLRHPVARIVSQYRHVALHGDPASRQHRKVMSGEVDVVRFSAYPFVGNAQAIFLEGLGVEGLAHAIIQEHFAATVERFCEAVDFDPKDARIQRYLAEPINSRENVAWETDAIPVDPACFPEIERNCARDLELYRRAVDRFVR